MIQKTLLWITKQLLAETNLITTSCMAYVSQFPFFQGIGMVNTQNQPQFD